MVILRSTQKLRSALPITEGLVGESDTALGDWYVNRVVVDRRPLLLLVSAKALLPMLIAAEVAAMTPVFVAPTVDRSVLGILVDTAKSVPFHLAKGHWDDETLPFVEASLAQTPWHVTKRDKNVVFPYQDVPRLLADRWGRSHLQRLPDDAPAASMPKPAPTVHRR